jgi:outer membrane protein assembly factor BamB
MSVTSRRHAQCTFKGCGICPLLLGSGLLLMTSANLVFAMGPGRSALPDAFRAEQLLWEIELGSHQYTIPRVDRGRVFVGINDLQLQHPAVASSGGGILLCLDEATGERIWQLPIPRYLAGATPPYHFNHWKCGVCSRPAIDGNRLYIVGPRGDVLCLDRAGRANGNDGPFLHDAAYVGVPDGSDDQLSETDGDIIWQFDMIKQLQVVPHDVCGSSPVLHGDFLYVCTSNGVDDTHDNVPNPRAPSLIVLDKTTGRLVGVDGELIGKRTLHGQWSSPVAKEFNGRFLILFGGGDGVLYAFEPLTASPSGDQPHTLQLAWKYDCCPSAYRQRDGEAIPYSRWNRKRPDGPSEIIATPVVYNDCIYLAIGQSPLHGKGQGLLSCIDGATGKKIWDTRAVDRTLSNAAISDGLLYVSDYTGQLHCLDAATGEHVWQHDLRGGVWCASPVIAGGSVYISTERHVLWILKAGREKRVLSRSRVRSMAITPAVQDDVLYLPTQRRLFAVKIK